MKPKQIRFVQEYVKNGCTNAVAAYIAAGYSANASAAACASRLLKNDEVQAEIQKYIDAAKDKAVVTAAEVLMELKRIATVDLSKAYSPDGHLLPIHEMPEDVRRAIAGIETEELWEFNEESQKKERVGTVTKVKTWDKNKALENLGRYFKMFTDKVETNELSGLAESIKSARHRTAKETKGESTEPSGT